MPAGQGIAAAVVVGQLSAAAEAVRGLLLFPPDDAVTFGGAARGCQIALGARGVVFGVLVHVVEAEAAGRIQMLASTSVARGREGLRMR
jgi:hypothetical protein